MSKHSITLFDYMESILLQNGHDEFFKDGVFKKDNLVFYNKEHSIIHRLLTYESDVHELVNSHLFFNHTLKTQEADLHFKKTFLTRFLNRQIKFQTIESFMAQLVHTFLIHENYLNQLYLELDKYVTGMSTTEQLNHQLNDGKTTTDVRTASASLPQSNVQLDVDNTIMETADENNISRNKQTNTQQTDGQTSTENKSFRLDDLIKTQGLLENVLIEFDKKCFSQLF